MWFYEPISVKDKPLGIPYARPADDPSSHGYVNLREQPDFIGQLPELRNSPQLRALVETLNSADSLFETYGCEKWSEQWSNEKFPGFNIRFGSYVDLAFVDKTRCHTQETYHHLVNAFQQHVERGERLSDAMHAGFELTPTVSLNNESWWTLSVWLFGVGRSEKEAEHWWKETLRVFQSFIASSPWEVLSIPFVSPS